tara:strand:- start:853 stop:1026 length:174 start_codon:yes stop_codon:yes gene_type:complete
MMDNLNHIISYGFAKSEIESLDGDIERWQIIIEDRQGKRTGKIYIDELARFLKELKG